MAREYLTSTDFVATVAGDFNLSGYIDRGNEHIESVAYSLGVTPSGVVEPIHYMLKEYGRAYVYSELYRDKIGAQNLDSPLSDKYIALLEIWTEQTDKLRKTLTPEILSGTADSSDEFAATTTLIYRS